VPKKQANPVDAHVGHRVRLRRMLVGMSQERLGELLGLTFQQVQKYEKGINRIGAGRLFEVASILCTISFFYENVDTNASPRALRREARSPRR
jgi:transcriptional regulator with XRE-family HTH domain